MKAVGVLWLLPFLTGSDASKQEQGESTYSWFTSYLTVPTWSSPPTTVPADILVRQAEQELWEPLPHQSFEQFQPDSEDPDDQNNINLYSDESLVNFPDPKDDDFVPQPLWATQTMKDVWDACNSVLVSAKSVPGFRQLTWNLFMGSEIIDDTLVFIYKPLVLPSNLDEHCVRLAYHDLAVFLYSDIDNIITERITFKQKTILLVGMGTSGLVAHYHAAMLIRKHPMISVLGGRRNLLHQVQVVTLNSPPAFTSQSALRFRMPKNNFVDIFTRGSVQEGSYVRWAYAAFYSPNGSSPRKNLITIDSETGRRYFNSQRAVIEKLSPTINESVIINKPEQMKTILTPMAELIEEAIMTAKSEFGKVQSMIQNEDNFSCMAALEEHLTDIMETMRRRADVFVNKNKLTKNWVPSGNVVCSPVGKGNDFTVLCKINRDNLAQFSLGEMFGHLEESMLGTSQQNILNEINEDDLDDIQASVFARMQTAENMQENSITDIEEDNLKCIKDLFAQRPLLNVFSPYNDQGISLDYISWTKGRQECEARLTKNYFLNKFVNGFAHSVFYKVMTSPDIKNPPSCIRSMNPQALRVTGNAESHLPRFLKYLDNPNGFVTNEEIFLFENSGHYQAQFITKRLLHYIRELLNDELTMYDCTNEQTLWHSPTFCPQICHVLPNDATFCKRVYVTRSGLKFTLRGFSYTEVKAFDYTSRDWPLFDMLRHGYPDRGYIFYKMYDTKLNTSYAWAFYLEGHVYETFIREYLQL